MPCFFMLLQCKHFTKLGSIKYFLSYLILEYAVIHSSLCTVRFTKLLSSSDMPSKTATGTIAIQVLDSNDHCPTLTTTHSTQCTDETTVYVTAFDEDANPNGAPFTFRVIPDGTRGSWDVEVVNGKEM